MTINWEPTGRPVIFFEPHQDDGALFMAQVAAHHMLANREVHVVLMSNGSTSSALQKINGDIHSGAWWGGFHDPIREEYAPLTADEFSEARTDEMINSWIQLGVPVDRIHVEDSLPDAVSQSYAASVINDWRTALPDAGLYTMHWNDAHADHANIGKALRAMRLAEPNLDARWTVKPEEATAANATAYAVPSNLLAEVKTLQYRAAVAYGAWAPDATPYAGSYAIGYHSVFDYFKNGPLAKASNWIVRNP